MRYPFNMCLYWRVLTVFIILVIIVIIIIITITINIMKINSLNLIFHSAKLIFSILILT